MYDLPIPDGNIYLIVKICVLILVLCVWMAVTAAPVY
jgi:hypothetical protein